MDCKIKKAIELAKKYHKGQFRKDGAEYVDHPLRVMRFLEKYGFPEDVLVVAILHDVCEDTDLTVLDINNIFGTRVGFMVNALSKNHKPKDHKKLKLEFLEKHKKDKVSNLEKYETLEEYIDFRFHLYINRLYMGIIAEPWVLFVKIGDQIDNLSDMKPFSKEKKLRKIEEVEKYFLPIYEKAEGVFLIDTQYIEKYKLFIELLKDVIIKAKKHI